MHVASADVFLLAPLPDLSQLLTGILDSSPSYILAQLHLRGFSEAHSHFLNSVDGFQCLPDMHSTVITASGSFLTHGPTLVEQAEQTMSIISNCVFYMPPFSLRLPLGENVWFDVPPYATGSCHSSQPHRLLGSCHAVHTQYNTGNIGRLIRSQKRKRIGNVFRLAQTPQRNSCDHRIKDFLGDCFHHISLSNAGATAFTRMPLGPNSRAKDIVRPFTANLDAG